MKKAEIMSSHDKAILLESIMNFSSLLIWQDFSTNIEDESKIKEKWEYFVYFQCLSIKKAVKT